MEFSLVSSGILGHYFVLLATSINQIYYIDYFEETNRAEFVRLEEISFDRIWNYLISLQNFDYPTFAKFNQDQGEILAEEFASDAGKNIFDEKVNVFKFDRMISPYEAVLATFLAETEYDYEEVSWPTIEGLYLLGQSRARLTQKLAEWMQEKTIEIQDLDLEELSG
jgi:hypothetical protein